MFVYACNCVACLLSLHDANELKILCIAASSDLPAMTGAGFCRRPIIQVMGPPLVTLGSGLGQWAQQLVLWGRTCATAGSLAVRTVLGPPMTACVAAIKAVAQFMLPLWQVCFLLLIQLARRKSFLLMDSHNTLSAFDELAPPVDCCPQIFDRQDHDLTFMTVKEGESTSIVTMASACLPSECCCRCLYSW